MGCTRQVPWSRSLLSGRLRAALQPGIAFILGISAFTLPVVAWSPDHPTTRGVAADTPSWTPAPAQPADYTFLDLELSLRARNALREVAARDVGVSVRNRVAILWGNVPSQEASQRAENRLKQVLGLTGIRNELHIKPGPKPEGSSPLPPIQQRAFLADRVVASPIRTQESVARRPYEHGPAPGREMTWRPSFSARQPIASTIGGPASSGEDERQTALPDANPGPAGWRPKDAASYQPPQSAERSYSAPTEQDLAQAVEVLRRRDERFAQVRPEVKDGIVYLRGTVYRWQHLYELARSVSLLRGVERVILEDVQTTTRP